MRRNFTEEDMNATSKCMEKYSISLGIKKMGINPHPRMYLAWKIPWTEEPGRLQSVGSLRVWHD